jgi:glycosyltransferase involved in cell wall biosynthesis
MAKYPHEWKQRVRVVPQGFDASAADVRGPRPEGPLRIVYTGRFYPGMRTPEAFLKAVAILHHRSSLAGRLAVVFVGGAMEAYERSAARLGLSDVVTFTGRRSPAGARADASAADVLLSIDAPSEGPSLFLPSKLVDYLPLGKPILGLTPAEGASAELLHRLGYPVVDPSNADAIAAAIDGLLRSHEMGALTASTTHDEVAHTYDIRETTRVLECVLDEALRTVPPS